MANIHTRSELHEGMKTNMKDWVKEAQEEDVSLSQLLNMKSPEPEGERAPQQAIHAMLQKEGLRMRSSRNFPASNLNEFYAAGKDYRRELLYGYMDDEYDKCFDTARNVRAPELELQGLPVNDYWRDYTDAPARDEKRIAPSIRLNDIVAMTTNIPGVDFRIPEYQFVEDAEQMVDVSEGTLIPVSTLKLGKRTVVLKKIALGLRWTYEFARNSPMRVDGIRRWVQRVATRHEMSLVKEGIETILSGLSPVAFSNNPALAADEDMPGFSLANHIKLHLQLDDPYQVDTILGGKTAIIRYLLTDVKSYGLNDFNSMNPALTPRARVMNQLGTSTKVGVLKDSFTGLTGSDADQASKMLLFDSNTTLAYLRQTGSQTDEMDTDPSQQLITRYLSRIYGFYLDDVNSRFLANMTSA